MAVRRQCNRYRTEPFGKDFDDVLKRGKAFHRDGVFMVWGGARGGVWMASRLPADPFALPADARVYIKGERRWHEITDTIER